MLSGIYGSAYAVPFSYFFLIKPQLEPLMFAVVESASTAMAVHGWFRRRNGDRTQDKKL